MDTASIPQSQTGYIYLVTNLVNGKKYVGQTIQKVSKRWRQHVREALNNKGYCFHDAIRKYGYGNFSVQSLTNCPRCDLDHYEQLAIEKYNALAEKGNGYNLTTGGDGGGIRSKQTRRKMSQATKRKWQNPDIRNKYIAARRATADDPEFRRKQGEYSRRRLSSIEARKRASEAAKKIWENPSYRKRRSEESKKMWENPAYRIKHLEAMKKALSKPESHRNKSEALKRRWDDPEYRKKMHYAFTHKAPISDEVRRHMSEAELKRFALHPMTEETKMKIGNGNRKPKHYDSC